MRNSKDFSLVLRLRVTPRINVFKRPFKSHRRKRARVPKLTTLSPADSKGFTVWNFMGDSLCTILSSRFEEIVTTSSE